MFKNIKTISSFSVKDIKKTCEFYGKTLGMEISDMPGMDDMIILNIAGGGEIVVYAKPDHEPATFTILNFPVDNIDNTVDELIKRGVTFEQYEGNLKTDEKGVFRGGPLVAWFKDPSGNILSVLERK